jgi:hypothetical protein
LLIANTTTAYRKFTLIFKNNNIGFNFMHKNWQPDKL